MGGRHVSTSCGCSVHCENCDKCEKCCECYYCEGCEAWSEWTCSNCELCENCCSCVTCENCDTKYSEGSEYYCFDCCRCTDCCECSGEDEDKEDEEEEKEDKTDKEGLQTAGEEEGKAVYCSICSGFISEYTGTHSQSGCYSCRFEPGRRKTIHFTCCEDHGGSYYKPREPGVLLGRLEDPV